MSITRDDVRHLHRLAHLAADDAALDRAARELDAIVGYVQQLQQVDTAGVAPLEQPGMPAVGQRADVPGAMFPIDAALANAPARSADAFLVPKVVER